MSTREAFKNPQYTVLIVGWHTVVHAEAVQECSFTTNDEKCVLDSLLQDLPHPISPTSCTDELRHMPEGNKDSGWRNCQHIVEKHDKDLCQAYREQIDTLLVFAGLFSAVVTAFAVESYQWLLDDPVDTSAELLRDVVRLLAQNLNQTAPLGPRTASHLSHGAVARINVFWFLSLTLSLSAALVGILCKQWLREFERDVGQSPEVALSIRYHKFRGLSYWNVGSIVNSVPIVLQVSLALFLIGIVELLWRLHSIVASCVSAVAGLTLVFYTATTFLPLIQYTYIILRCCGGDRINKLYPDKYAFTQPQCAFKSPQAWIALRVFQPAIEYVIRTYCSTFVSEIPPHYPLVLRPAHSWVTFDINWMKRHDCLHFGGKSVYETLAWVAENLEETHLSSSIWQCIWGRWLKNRNNLDEVEAAAADIECVARAYPQPLDIRSHKKPRIRGQAFIFQCSLRTTLSVDTAVEMMLRIAPEMGVNSRWTCEAVKTVLVTYRDISFRLSEDMASGLFHLAQMQTHALIQRPSIASDDAQNCGAEGFFRVFELLLRGAGRGERLLPAMCALALQWLRAHRSMPRSSNVAFTEAMISHMIRYYSSRSHGPARLHQYPGVIFPARLAGLVAEIIPDFPRYHATNWLYGRRILARLLEISRANPGNVADCAPSSETPPAASTIAPVRDGDGERPAFATAPHISPAAPVHGGDGGLATPENSPSFATAGHIKIQTDADADVDLNSAASPIDKSALTER